MPTKFILAAAACTFFATQVFAQVPAAPKKLNAVLCETENQAMDLAATMASGRTEPIAINLVNKAAGSEVCGRYIGLAIVEMEKTKNRDGGLFMLAALRFVKDGRLAWTANWVTPFDGSSLARGT